MTLSRSIEKIFLSWIRDAPKMNEVDRRSEETASASTSDTTLTRSALCELVWAEPMLKVAARFELSSSHMARVCTLMNVPRPERGYWAKLAIRQRLPKPELPETRPGDQMIWIGVAPDAEARLEGLDSDRREQIRDRLKQARDLIGSIDALERFGSWRAPSER